MSRGPRTQLLIRLSYDGSAFYGVTPQPGLPTVADALRRRLEDAFGGRARSLVVGARTDAGVHALENLATCWLGPDAPLASSETGLLDGLRQVRAARPDGLLDCVAVPVDRSVFARTVGHAKHYRYRIEGQHDPAWIATLRQRDVACRKDPSLPRLPPQDGRIWQVALPLDPQPMRQAAAHLIGCHDFRSFKVGPLGARSPLRTIHSIHVHALRRAGRPHLVIDVVGPGFLRKMVRIVVGTLAEVAAGLREPDQLSGILAAADRQVSGQAALARGLLLHQIETQHPYFPRAKPGDPGGEPAVLPQPGAQHPQIAPPR